MAAMCLVSVMDEQSPFGAEVFDVLVVMFERMLVGGQKTIWTYTARPKNFVVEVKSSEGVVEGVEGVFSYNVLVCNVTKIEESVEGLDDISGHITL